MYTKQIERAEAATPAPGKTKNFYSTSIFPDFVKIIKKKYNHFSILFWRKNYGLEMNRQDHAAAGHLYREIGACLILLMYKAIGRVLK